MAALRSGIKDKLSKTPPSSSSARDNQKQLGTDISRRNLKMGVPFKVRGNRSEKGRFLAAEETVKLKFDTKAVSSVTHETTNALADEKHFPGFLSKKSAIESVTIAKGSGDRLCERVALKEPRGKEVGLILRRGSVKEIQADAAILPEKVEASIMSENSTSNAVSLHMKPPPIGSSGESINFPSGSSSSCGMVRERSLHNISPTLRKWFCLGSDVEGKEVANKTEARSHSPVVA